VAAGRAPRRAPVHPGGHTRADIAIGRSAEDAVKTAYKQGRTVIGLSDIEDGEPIPWAVITADLRKACMTEFHQTPYGTVLLDMG
jgi:hypothetical protein